MMSGAPLRAKKARKWRDRIWFYRPGSWRPGWRVIQWRNADEYDWHTLAIGSRLTGAVVIARHPCRGTGRCADHPTSLAPTGGTDA